MNRVNSSLDRTESWFAYDLLAAEYYSPAHKTCRNFDAATRAALSVCRPPICDTGPALDFGAGRGRGQEFLGIEGNRIIQCDRSLAMLQVQPRESCLLQVHCDARSTPFLDGTFTVAVAFLFDAFNDETFIEEAFRILKPGGVFVGTLPAYEWGITLRRQLNLPDDVTRFVTQAGGTLTAPSAIVPNDQLVQRAEGAGFSDIEVRNVCLPPEVDVISPDILIAAEKLGTPTDQLGILQIVSARKPG